MTSDRLEIFTKFYVCWKKGHLNLFGTDIYTLLLLLLLLSHFSRVRLYATP